jgi:large subunit ribosomal protein L9
MKEKLILRQDVEYLGLAGEVVEVAKGYARNYLLPKKFALKATPANEKALAAVMASVAERKMKQEEAARAKAAALEELTLTITAKVGETGRLFGSVTSMNIAEALAEAGHEIDRRRIELRQPLKVVGLHEVNLKLTPGVTATLKVQVVGEGGPEPAEAMEEGEPEASQEEAPEAAQEEEPAQEVPSPESGEEEEPQP